MKWRPNLVSEVYGWGAGTAERLYESGAFHAAASVAEKLLSVSHGRQPRTLEFRLQVIRWATAKEVGGIAAVEDEINKYDFSGLELRLSYARALLLDDDAVASDQIETLIERGELSKSELMLSRVFEGLRERLGREWLGTL